VAPLREQQQAKAEEQQMKAAASKAQAASPRGATGGTPKRQAGAYKETELLQRIGQGTYGSVFRGMCNGEEVAVKVMPLQSDTAEDIKREIKIMRECACDYIIAYRDAFIREHEMRSTLWVVMEFCRVGSTLDVMRRHAPNPKPFTEQQSAWVIRGMLYALDYMHTERRAIHRDIKAANVLLTADASVKLADLGVAAQLYNTMSKRGTMIGTPHWMAPETLGQMGEDGKYDFKVDIWGVAITAIELAQLAPPFADTKSVFKVCAHAVPMPRAGKCMCRPFCRHRARLQAEAYALPTYTYYAGDDAHRQRRARHARARDGRLSRLPRLPARRAHQGPRDEADRRPAARARVDHQRHATSAGRAGRGAGGGAQAGGKKRRRQGRGRG
jgi:hypothetical protein